MKESFLVLLLFIFFVSLHCSPTAWYDPDLIITLIVAVSELCDQQHVSVYFVCVPTGKESNHFS